MAAAEVRRVTGLQLLDGGLGEDDRSRSRRMLETARLWRDRGAPGMNSRVARRCVEACTESHDVTATRIDAMRVWLESHHVTGARLPAHPAVREVLVRAPGWVFPSPVTQGAHVLPGTMSKWLGQALPTPWTAHSLRHAFATSLYLACRDLAIVRDALGHDSVKTTEAYVLVDQQRLNQAVAALEWVA